MPGSEAILAERKTSSLWLTINRPVEKNALTAEMLGSLSAHLTKAWESSSIQVIVLRGRGDAFSSGLDLRRLFATREAARELFEALNDACLAIRRTRQPVVAVVDGPCVAGGLQLAASCDLLLASDRATFQAPGARLGFLHSSPAAPLTRSLSSKHAMEFLLLGDPVPAERAREMGLANWVAPADKLASHAEELVAKMASRLEFLRGDGKAGLYEQDDMDEEKAYGFLVDKMLSAWDTGIPKRLAEKILGKEL